MSKQITIAKFGSELLVNDKGVDHERIGQYANGLMETYGEDGLVVVTSGAVAAGRMRMERKGKDTTGWDNVTLAQLGSASITHAWESAFDTAGADAGGLLTTHHEIEDIKEGPSLIRAMKLALGHGVVSIVNENDALSNTELMKLACGGDNDGLASHLAQAIGADSLKLFTKSGGIRNEDNVLVEEVNKDNYLDIWEMLCLRDAQKEASGSGIGRGGILSKLEAAWSAARVGVVAEIMATNFDMTGDRITRVVVG